MMVDGVSAPTLAIIVAMDSNRGIGNDNKLLWYIPEDLQFFKRTTMGKPLIMGRKTFESIGKPLPGRLSIIITQQQNWHFDGVEVAHNFEQAVAIANIHANNHNQAGNHCSKEIMVVGGEQIYTLALPFAERIYLTEVDACLQADAFFPDINHSQWRLLSESPTMGTKVGYSLRYKVFVRTGR
jgi:dihydrofolate reductase